MDVPKEAAAEASQKTAIVHTYATGKK